MPLLAPVTTPVGPTVGIEAVGTAQHLEIRNRIRLLMNWNFTPITD